MAMVLLMIGLRDGADDDGCDNGSDRDGDGGGGVRPGSLLRLRRHTKLVRRETYS